jgi:lipopolysaccharide export system permease protein
MRILTRYILWEMLATFLVTLGSMTIFVFLGLIGKEAVENGLGLGPILRLLPYMLPQAMQFSVPGALLLAATSVYGRVSSSNEIVAIKALGISPMIMLWPTLMLATVVSFGAVVLNDVAVSWGRGGVERVIVESLEEIAYGRLRTAGSFTTDRLSVNVRDVVGRRLIRPVISFKSGGDSPSLITADAAELHADVANSAVTITLLNADGAISGWNVTHPGEFVRSFPMDEFTGGISHSRRPTSYAMNEISDTIKATEGLIHGYRRDMSSDAGAGLLFGQFDDFAQSRWQSRSAQINGARQTLFRLETEPHRRWANGFSCLAFVLIGAPMAIRRKHGEFWGSFFACFLPILIIYYPMLVGAIERSKDGVLPPQSMWLGNVVLAAWGVYLMRKVVRF